MIKTQKVSLLKRDLSVYINDNYYIKDKKCPPLINL